MTLLLVVEIAIRFTVDWRHFFNSKRNWVDLGIAIVTAIIQIPPIRNSGQPYAWLTFFQILRFYRIVLAVSITRDLIVSTDVGVFEIHKLTHGSKSSWAMCPVS